MDENRTPPIFIPLQDIELLAFFDDVMIVESLFGTHGIDTTEFARGDAIEDTCRGQLPADRLILRR